MTTTALAMTQSTYDKYITHAHFTARSSTPTTGDAFRMGANFFVVEGGVVLPEFTALNVLDFQHVTLTTRDIYCQAFDVAGNLGAFEFETLTVNAQSNAARIRYVDSVTGDDGNDGTIGSPFETPAAAKSYFESTNAADDTHIVFFAKGGSYSGNLWQSNVGGTDLRMVFSSYGSGAKPAMSHTGGDFVNVWTTQHSMVLVGLDVDMGDGRIQLGGGHTRTAPYDFILYDTDITSSHNNPINGDDAGFTRNDGTGDFLAFVGSTITGTAGSGATFLIYGFQYARYVLIHDTAFGPVPNVSTSATLRVMSWSDAFFSACSFDPQYSGFGSLRFQQGPGSGNALLRITFHDCEALSHAPVIAQNGGAANDVYHVEDVRLVSCNFKFHAQQNQNGESNAFPVTTRVQHINCWWQGGYQWETGTNASHDDYEFLDSLTVSDTGFRFEGDLSKFADDFLTVKGCVTYSPSGATKVYHIAATSHEALAAKILASDYNVAARGDGTPSWTYEDSGGSNRDLANWQGDTGFDSNSNVGASTTLPLTSTPSGDGEPFDATLTADGYLAGKGWPRALGIDMLGKLRDTSTPFAGPHERGATATPDEPPTGSGAARSLFASLAGPSPLFGSLIR